MYSKPLEYTVGNGLLLLGQGRYVGPSGGEGAVLPAGTGKHYLQDALPGSLFGVPISLIGDVANHPSISHKRCSPGCGNIAERHTMHCS